MHTLYTQTFLIAKKLSLRKILLFLCRSFPDSPVKIFLTSIINFERKLMPAFASSYVLCSAATFDTTKSSSLGTPQVRTPSPTPRSKEYCQVCMSDLYIFIVIPGTGGSYTAVSPQSFPGLPGSYRSQKTSSP